jgi:hypothetical protein
VLQLLTLLLGPTVGVILRWLSDRAGFLGQIVLAPVGFAWTLGTSLVGPIIVIERKTAIDRIGDSKDLRPNTWGQQPVSGLGTGGQGMDDVAEGIDDGLEPAGEHGRRRVA